jgi:hypothetical protein
MILGSVTGVRGERLQTFGSYHAVMDRFDYIERELERREKSLMLLGLTSALCLLFGVMCLGAAGETEDRKTSGHLWWKSEEAVANADAVRTGWMLAGVLFIVIALALTLLAYRSAKGRRALADWAFSSGAANVPATQPVQMPSGPSWDFWQTVIAAAGLLVAALGVAAAWLR